MNASPSGGVDRPLVFTGQQATGQRVVGNDGDAFGAAEGQEFTFDRSIEQVVARLDRDDLDPVLDLGSAEARAMRQAAQLLTPT